MPHATLIVDGYKHLDDDLEEWHQAPPEFLASLMRPGARPEPYLKAAALALVEAIHHQQPVTITITTRPTGWTMSVHHWMVELDDAS